MGKNENVELSEKKIEGALNKDKVVILSIVISVIVICFVTFGIYMYKTSYKDIAKFDGGKLTRTEYELYYKMFMPMLQMYGYPPETIPEEIAKKATLDRVLLMLAKKDNMTLTEEEKAEIDKTFKDEKQMEQMKRNKMNLEELRKLYESDALIQRYIKNMKENLSDEDVKNYLVKTYGKDVDLKEYVTRNLLISTTDNKTGAKLSDADKAKAKEKAVNAINRLKNGENFEKLVKELSDDEGTKNNGGLYSVYMDESTVKEYKEAAMKLEVGKYTTEPVETQFGYHVIYLEKINQEGRLKSDKERAPVLNDKIEELNKTYNVSIDKKALKSYSDYLDAEIRKLQEEEMKRREEEEKKKQEVDVYDKK